MLVHTMTMTCQVRIRGSVKSQHTYRQARKLRPRTCRRVQGPTSVRDAQIVALEEDEARPAGSGRDTEHAQRPRIPALKCSLVRNNKRRAVLLHPAPQFLVGPVAPFNFEATQRGHLQCGAVLARYDAPCNVLRHRHVDRDGIGSRSLQAMVRKRYVRRVGQVFEEHIPSIGQVPRVGRWRPLYIVWVLTARVNADVGRCRQTHPRQRTFMPRSMPSG